ncbi:MAG: HDIG domain-containing protein [Spirochaetaceae bacterium]|jgi:putative nucleotidyltransferase with HDIG domain|nr:HDIG domain-containing protein [Spirochaetaceae bacterium]
MMKKNNDGSTRDTIVKKFFRTARFRFGPAVVTTLAFIVSASAIIGGRNSNAASVGDLTEFEIGRVAERDVIAEQSVSYIDEDATRLRLEAAERLVPAVFAYSLPVNAEMRKTYDRFTALSEKLFSGGASSEAYRLAVQAEFPGAFSGNTLDILFRDPGRDQLLEYGSTVLNYLLETGIFALPEIGLEVYNPDMVELLHNYGPRTERELIAYSKIPTRDNMDYVIDHYTGGGAFPSSFKAIAGSLLEPFVTENVFFSPEDTNRRLAEARAQVEPVVKEIQRGDRIIRKGFIVAGEDMARLTALNMTLSRNDPRIIIGQILILLLVYSLIIYLSGERTLGRALNHREVYLLATLAAAYLIGAVLVSGFSFDSLYFPVSIFLPTALVVMLPSILIGSRVAISMAMMLPLSAFLSGTFDTSAYILALTSGVAAAITLHGAEKRMDLVKAGCIIAAVNSVAALGILLIQRCVLSEYPLLLFWAAFNGIASGMLVLGCLPLMEHALNAATTFRLIELADLNSPVLKRLFTAAPGTYSHSIMVANLAESACQEIGANALLARVGAYYHDIGKMDQPDYFVENQTVYNKHDDIAPRLSATVIRSHVKLGVEKGRSLGLPQEVTDIIAEHHGNSVISWFYNEALKRESQVDVEDFTYPGNPPRSRESAVVMLADVTEAAVRTLKKPTAARLEKFIQELIMAKFEHGQLSESELTFRDLETIKKAFVRVLAGHYHSRIEYPKAVKEAPWGSAAPNGGAHEPN